MLSAGAGHRKRGRKPRLTASEVKLLAFALTAASFGVIGLAAAYESPELVTTAHITIVRTIWFWFALSLAVHLLARLVRGRGTLRESATDVFSVMPMAYFVGAFSAMTVAVAIKPFASEELRYIIPTTVFMLAQFLVVAKFLPGRLKTTHAFGRKAAATMFVVPAFVLGVNVTLAAVPIYSAWKASVAKEQEVVRMSGPAFIPVLDKPEQTKLAKVPPFVPVFDKRRIVFAFDAPVSVYKSQELA
jgi:hypothetical protein